MKVKPNSDCEAVAAFKRNCVEAVSKPPPQYFLEEFRDPEFIKDAEYKLHYLAGRLEGWADIAQRRRLSFFAGHRFGGEVRALRGLEHARVIANQADQLSTCFAYVENCRDTDGWKVWPHLCAYTASEVVCTWQTGISAEALPAIKRELNKILTAMPFEADLFMKTGNPDRTKDWQALAARIRTAAKSVERDMALITGEPLPVNQPKKPRVPKTCLSKTRNNEKGDRFRSERLHHLLTMR